MRILKAYSIQELHDALFVPQGLAPVYDIVEWAGAADTELNATNTGIVGQPTISLTVGERYSEQTDGTINRDSERVINELEGKIQQAVDGISTRRIAYSNTGVTLTVAAADALINGIDEAYRAERTAVVISMAKGTKFDDGSLVWDFKYAGQIEAVIGAGGSITYVPNPDDVDDQLSEEDEARLAAVELLASTNETELAAEKAKIVTLQTDANKYKAFDNVQRLLANKYQPTETVYTSGLDLQQNGQNIEISATGVADGTVAVLVKTTGNVPFFAEGTASGGVITINNNGNNYDYILGLTPTSVTVLEASVDAFDETQYDDIATQDAKISAAKQEAIDAAATSAELFEAFQLEQNRLKAFDVSQGSLVSVSGGTLVQNGLNIELTALEMANVESTKGFAVLGELNGQSITVLTRSGVFDANGKLLIGNTKKQYDYIADMTISNIAKMYSNKEYTIEKTNEVGTNLNTSLNQSIQELTTDVDTSLAESRVFEANQNTLSNANVIDGNGFFFASGKTMNGTTLEFNTPGVADGNNVVVAVVADGNTTFINGNVTNGKMSVANAANQYAPILDKQFTVGFKTVGTLNRISEGLATKESKNTVEDYTVVDGTGQGITYAAAVATERDRVITINTSLQFETIKAELYSDSKKAYHKRLKFVKVEDENNAYVGIQIKYDKSVDLAMGGAIIQLTGKA